MNSLEIKNLTKTYRDFTLDHISFCLPEGCIMGFVGENGAGKSTTIKLILNMIQADGGEVSIFGQSNQVDLKAKKENIGVVLDEIGFPECISAKELNNVLRYAYENWDTEVYTGYLEKFKLPLNKPFKEYSRGMKMKLGITAALSHHAKLLILDEATSGLDPVVREEVLDILNEFTREENHSVLISSHIVSDLERLCDYIAFLHKGRLVLCDEKDRLLEHYGMVHCTHEQFKRLDANIVVGKKESHYGIEAIMERINIPDNMKISPIGIEDLFVYMAKERN